MDLLCSTRINENKNNNFESTILEATSQAGNTEAVQFLLDIGVNIENQNDKGNSSLLGIKV